MRPSRAGDSARRVVGTLLLVLVALGSNAETTRAQPRAAGQAVALARFVHASPDAAALDLAVDGAVVVSGLGFGGATDAFVSVAPGSHLIAATLSGEAGAGVAERWVDFAAGGAYAIGVAGMVAEAFVALYPLDLSPPTDGWARMRLINAAPDLGSVVVANADGEVLTGGAAFSDAGEYVDVGAGAHDLLVLAADDGSAILDLGAVGLEAGATYEMVVLGLAGDGSLFVLPLVGAAFAGAGASVST
jgi:hypothetical protein